MVNAALYARCSTLNGQDPEVQLRELRLYAAARGWTIVNEYVDHGVSGSKDRRPALDRLMADARAGAVQVVLCWKFDRFARSVKFLLTTLEEFRSLKIDFASVTEQIDTSTASGRMVFAVIASMSEFERSLIVERVRAGIAKAKATGTRLGRPRRWTEAQAERAARLRAEGKSWSNVAQSVGLKIGTVRGAVAELAARNPAA